MQLSLLFGAAEPRLRIMSIPVDPTKLGEELKVRPLLLLTVSDDDTSHVAHMTFRLQQDDLYCPISKNSGANIEARPNVVVLWPPYEPNGYSMIVDAECEETNGCSHVRCSASTGCAAPGELECGNVAHHWVPRVSGPLTGIRVLELKLHCRSLCWQLLGDYGAEVIKIEPPGQLVTPCVNGGIVTPTATVIGGPL